MITKFNAGNISPFCEGFLNNIYDGAQRMIEDRLNHPEHGEMDARFVKEAVESSWAAEMSTQYEADRQGRSGRERPRVPPSDSKDAVNDGGCDHQGQAAGDGYNCSIETPLGEPDSEADKQEDDGDGLPQGALGPARELGVQFVEGLHVPRGSCLGVQNKKACGDLVFL